MTCSYFSRCFLLGDWGQITFMGILYSLLDIVFAGRKKPSGHRRGPSRKKGRRLRMEHVEPRRMLSASMTGDGGADNLYDLTTVALLAGTNQYPPSLITGDGLGLSAKPVAPSLTATAVSKSQIDLAWTGVSGATAYLVDMLLGNAWRQIGSFDAGTTACTVIGLRTATTYSFEVAASSSAGRAWSTSQSATTLGGILAPPAAPLLTATTVSASQINLEWGGVSGATGYLVDELINGVWTQIGSLGSGSTGCSVTGLSASTTYSFEVGAYNSAGTAWSTSHSATTLAAAAVVNEPAAATAYSPVSGSLFGAGGPSFLDVHQGEVGDCWLMASLAEVAARDPADIQDMFTAAGTTVVNGSTVNLYTVRFFNSAGVAQYVTVDTELPSAGGYYDQVSNGVLWVALAEKAYAEANAAGNVTTQYVGSDSYAALNGGDPAWALRPSPASRPAIFTSTPRISPPPGTRAN